MNENAWLHSNKDLYSRNWIRPKQIKGHIVFIVENVRLFLLFLLGWWGSTLTDGSKLIQKCTASRIITMILKKKHKVENICYQLGGAVNLLWLFRAHTEQWQECRAQLACLDRMWWGPERRCWRHRKPTGDVRAWTCPGTWHRHLLGISAPNLAVSV